MESLLAIIFGSVVSPIVTAGLKRLSWVDSSLGAAINLCVCLTLYLTGWWLVAGADRALLEQWLTWALAAGGVGNAANNLYRNKVAGAGTAAGLIVLALVSCLLVSGCATSPCLASTTDAVTQRACLYESFDRQLRSANAAYEETIIAAGAAAERHVINDQQLATVRGAGIRAKAAIVAARAALAAAIDVGAGGNPWGAVADAQTALAALIAAAAQEGVAK